jgi:hypothetical protein
MANKRIKRTKRAYEASQGEFNSGLGDNPGSLEKLLLERSLALTGQDAPLRAIQSQAMAAAEDPGARIDNAIGRAQTDVHAAAATAGQPKTMRDIVGSNLVRARGLTRVATAGDAAVKAQALKDRIAMSKFGRGRTALALGQGEVGIDMAQQRKTALNEMDRMRADAYGNAAGAVAGGLMSWAQNRNNQALANGAEMSGWLKTMRPEMNAALDSIPKGS